MERARMVLTRGPFASPVKVERALCPDGKRRTAWITGEADTFFSIPARVTYKGRTVTGFVTYGNAEGLVAQEDSDDYQFHANKFGKNGHLFDA